MPSFAVTPSECYESLCSSLVGTFLNTFGRDGTYSEGSREGSYKASNNIRETMTKPAPSVRILFLFKQAIGLSWVAI